MNRDIVRGLLDRLGDAANAGAYDVERGMPQDDTEELIGDLQHCLDLLHAEVRK